MATRNNIDPALRKYPSLLRPGHGIQRAILIASTPNVFDTLGMLMFYEDITHTRPMCTPDLIDMARRAGYMEVRSYLAGPVRSPYRRLLAKISSCKPYNGYIVHALSGWR